MRIEIWGENACFTKGDFSVERISEPVPTPSAIKGILDSIYWHPNVKYLVRKIHVLNPISYATVMRNELKSVPSGKKLLACARRGEILDYNSRQDATQRVTMLLRNPHYVIDFDIRIEAKDIKERMSNYGKASGIIKRRIESGQYFHAPSFGMREYVCYFGPYDENAPVPCPTALRGTKDLGFVFYGYDYTTDIPAPMFYHPIMVDGTIDVPAPDSKEVYR